jgi:hypothetical protein
MDSDTIRQMLSEATPGPWTMDERKHKCGAISARISAPEWDDFARVWVGLKDPAGARDDGIANARLIAAAPDLAAEVLRLRSALQQALNYIENTESELGITLDCGNVARAALKETPNA